MYTFGTLVQDSPDFPTSAFSYIPSSKLFIVVLLPDPLGPIITMLSSLSKLASFLQSAAHWEVSKICIANSARYLSLSSIESPSISIGIS